MERYALLWLFSSLVILGLAVWQDALTVLARAARHRVGARTRCSSSRVAFILLLLLHFSAAMSRLTDQSKVLAQRQAILEQRLSEVEHARAVAAGDEARDARAPAARRRLNTPMCGICGAINLRGEPIPDLPRRLEVMNDLIAHRGPDDAGTWMHPRGHVGFGHRRLAIIDPTPAGHQPMRDDAGRWITYNGEVYNYPELRLELGGRFRTGCDTEVVLRAYERWGADSLDHLRGMFAYALWDEVEQELLCARDRFGIKPFYYAQVGDVLYFASEAKALLPFLPAIETDLEGLKDYLAFQFCLAGKTLFEGVSELLPGHRLRVRSGTRACPSATGRSTTTSTSTTRRSTSRSGSRRCCDESVRLHLRSDVPVAAYLSGGLDSTSVASLAAAGTSGRMKAFTGRFPEDSRYDESEYAQVARRRARASTCGWSTSTSTTSSARSSRSIYHLDHPVAGPGSFPQYMVSAGGRARVRR